MKLHPDTKVCAICKKELNIDLFGNRPKSKDGKRPSCKKCTNKANKKSRDRPKISREEAIKQTEHLQMRLGDSVITSKSINRFVTLENDLNKKHNNKYSYSESVFNGMLTLMKVECPDHGIWNTTPDNHLRGKGCSKCGEIRKESLQNNNKPTRVYYIKIEKPELKHPIYKVGITSRDKLIYRMYGLLKKEDYTVIWMSNYMTRLEAVTKEQKILADNKEFRYRGRDLLKPNGEPFVSREFFVKDIYDKNEGVWNETKTERLPD